VIEHSPTGHAFQQAYPQANPYEAIRSRGPGQVVKRTWLRNRSYRTSENVMEELATWRYNTRYVN